MQFLSFFNRFFLPIFFICQICWPVAYPVSACIVEFYNVTRKKERKKEGKKKKKVAPFIPRFINTDYFSSRLFPRLFIVCGPDENAHAVCVCPILLFVSGEFFLLKGEGRRGRRPMRPKRRKREEVSFILESRTNRVNALLELSHSLD